MTDFNNAGPQRTFDVIPAGTIATLHLTVRTGGAGEGGWLRRSKDGNSEGLDCEFTVVDGPCAKRKFWSLFTLAGTTPNHAAAGEISASRLRAILESARGIRPDDNSDAARRARQTASYGDFDGLRFVARIGVEPAQANYRAKNTLDEVITPERKDWHAVVQVAKDAVSTPVTPATAMSAPAKIVRPDVGELTKHENAWQDRATAAAIAAARRVVLGDAAVIPMNTSIGRLSDVEWGWIVAAGWIATRAEQATAEGLDTERAIRLTGYDTNPWDAGAVATILPELADETTIDWSKPLEAWSRETMISFLVTALALVRKATLARDSGGGTITRKPAADLNDSIPL